MRIANKNKSNKKSFILKPNKLLGQNFLRDKNVLAKIIQAADLKAGERVLEIGPGLGALTEELAKNACRVIAVEKDKRLAVQLKNKFQNNQNVEIIQDDILSFLRKQESRSWIPAQGRDDKFSSSPNYKVIANIPYYLTSHLIRLLLESANPPQDIVLLIQKEVAQRICPPRRARSSDEAGAKPPKMSLLAVSVQFYAQPKIISYVPKGAFWPKPKVDSAIIRITPHNSPSAAKRPPYNSPPYERVAGGDLERNEILPHPPFTKKEIERFFRLVRAGFAHPRKQLLNNLSKGLKLKREKIIKVLRSANIEPKQRAETLMLNDWLNLTKLIQP